MRILGTVLLAAIVSGFIAGIIQVQLGIALGAQEEFIAVMMAQSLFVIALAMGLLLAAVSVGTTRAVTAVAVVLSGLAVAGALAIEAAGLVTGAAGSPEEMIATDGPILLEMVVPALVAALVQWWIVWRHVRKTRRAAALS